MTTDEELRTKLRNEYTKMQTDFEDAQVAFRKQMPSIHKAINVGYELACVELKIDKKRIQQEDRQRLLVLLRNVVAQKQNLEEWGDMNEVSYMQIINDIEKVFE